MSDVIIHKINETYVGIETSLAIERDFYNVFSFTNKKLQYHPKVKARLWDGYIHCFNMRSKRIYIGLIGDIASYCKQEGLTYEFRFSKKDNYNEEVYKSTLDLIEDEFELYDHQKLAVDSAIEANRGLIVSSTASGKSLILYFLSMYYLLNGNQKVLIVVPRTQLVKQLSDAFVEYHKGDKDEFRKSFDLIYGTSKERNEDSPITFTTWQSVYAKDASWFEKFDCVLVDEAHTAKATSLTTIMENCINAKHKFGFTGTLTNTDEETEVHELILRGLFGKVMTVSTNKELMDKGILSKALINVIHVKYDNKDTCEYIMKGTKEIQAIDDIKTKRKKLFENEIDFILNLRTRNVFIQNLALSSKNNTLIMFQFVEKHGDVLYEMLSEVASNFEKEVYYINGKTSVKERERIRELIERKDNIILISSYGTTSTGIDIKNVHNIILATGFKSDIVMKQTIGRGLRTHKTKDKVIIYDICDDFSRGKKGKNFLYKHFLKRMDLYQRERFEVKISERELHQTLLKQETLKGI